MCDEPGRLPIETCRGASQRSLQTAADGAAPLIDQLLVPTALLKAGFYVTGLTSGDLAVWAWGYFCSYSGGSLPRKEAEREREESRRQLEDYRAYTSALVDMMDGSIHVASEKGHGSCFTVRLPRAEE